MLHSNVRAFDLSGGVRARVLNAPPEAIRCPPFRWKTRTLTSLAVVRPLASTTTSKGRGLPPSQLHPGGRGGSTANAFLKPMEIREKLPEIPMSNRMCGCRPANDCIVYERMDAMNSVPLAKKGLSSSKSIRSAIGIRKRKRRRNRRMGKRDKETRENLSEQSHTYKYAYSTGACLLADHLDRHADVPQNLRDERATFPRPHLSGGPSLPRSPSPYGNTNLLSSPARNSPCNNSLLQSASVPLRAESSANARRVRETPRAHAL